MGRDRGLRGGVGDTGSVRGMGEGIGRCCGVLLVVDGSRMRGDGNVQRIGVSVATHREPQITTASPPHIFTWET